MGDWMIPKEALAAVYTQCERWQHEHGVVYAELADAKAIARYETDCVEAAKEHITKLDAELSAKDARIAELEAEQALHIEAYKSMLARAERAEAERDALLYNAESQYCAGMGAGFELGRNDDRSELSRIITQRWMEIADAKGSAAHDHSLARQGSIPDRTFERDLAELRAVDRMRAERDSLREALQGMLDVAEGKTRETGWRQIDAAHAALAPEKRHEEE